MHNVYDSQYPDKILHFHKRKFAACHQSVAAEHILNRIEIAHDYKKYDTLEDGGYIWDTTGSIKTTGTDIDKILPAVSRFGGGNRKAKKETVIEKLKAFFERFWNI